MPKQITKRRCRRLGGSWENGQCHLQGKESFGWSLGGWLLFIIILFALMLAVGAIVLYTLNVVFSVGTWSWTNAFLLGLVLTIIGSVGVGVRR